MANENEAILFEDLTDDEIREFTEGLIPAEEGTEGWKITNDSAADWAVRKVKEEEAEYARLNALAHDRIAEINMQVEAAEKRMQSKTAYLKSKLAEYFGTVPHRETKTQEQYQLLSGKLVFTKPKATFEKDGNTLLAYLKESGYTEYIQTVEKPMWEDFKKNLAIMDGKVINQGTGEIVEAVRIAVSDAKFEVK